jgi:hypothetical protein
MILKNMHDRLAFRFGRQSGVHSTSDTVEQLQAQIDRLQEQLKFNAPSTSERLPSCFAT